MIEETPLTPEEIARLEADAKQPQSVRTDEERLSYFKEENAYLHIYGQEQWHGEAYMVANLQGLLAMRKAIDDAIEKGHGYLMAFVGDGEGFNTMIARVDDPKEFDKLAVPYRDEIASEKQEDAVWPWKLPRIDLAQDEAIAELERKYPRKTT